LVGVAGLCVGHERVAISLFGASPRVTMSAADVVVVR